MHAELSCRDRRRAVRSDIGIGDCDFPHAGSRSAFAPSCATSSLILRHPHDEVADGVEEQRVILCFAALDELAGKLHIGGEKIERRAIVDLREEKPDEP